MSTRGQAPLSGRRAATRPAAAVATALLEREPTRRPVTEVLRPHLARLRRTGLDPLDASRPALVRRAWQDLCDDGLAGVCAPARWGGTGQGLTAAVDRARDLAAVPCALPYLTSAVLAPLLARAAGATGLLAELVTGDRIAAVARGGRLTADRDGLAVDGLLPDALHGVDADVWLVVTQTRDGHHVLVEIEQPDHEVVPTADPTRPVAQARLRSARAGLLLDGCAEAVVQAALRTEVVRCAEVVAAAALLPADAAPADVGRSLLRAAAGAVDLAAAAADVDGRPDACLVRAATAWTARVSAGIAVSDSADDTARRFHRHRALQATPWAPAAGLPGWDLPA